MACRLANKDIGDGGLRYLSIPDIGIPASEPTSLAFYILELEGKVPKAGGWGGIWWGDGTVGGGGRKKKV